VFIIAANSWMQNPVGYTLDPTTQAPQLTSIGDIFTNPVFLPAYLHVIVAALLYGSTVMLAVSAWHLRRGSDVSLFHRTAKLGIWVLLVTSILQFRVGGVLGQEITKVQPMKVASMEASWDTCQPCSFSLFQIGGWTPDDPATKIIEIPYLLSILATGDPHGQVLGINQVQQQETAAHPQNGDIQYYPNVFVQYWSLRAMAYFAGIAALVGLWGVFLLWRRKLDSARLFQRVASWAVLIPFVMGTGGWVLTENGRQPWIVQGLMLTKDGLSTSVSAAEVAISLVVFFLLYSVIGVIALVLMLRHVRSRPEPDETASDDAGDRVPELTY
jgi:cytochrome d ubiquinol oxidase subunit I